MGTTRGGGGLGGTSNAEGMASPWDKAERGTPSAWPFKLSRVNESRRGTFEQEIIGRGIPKLLVTTIL